ncbi:retrovirus-related pol polyprotein from transposon TNT 1-94 [Tanacetum coccineum]
MAAVNDVPQLVDKKEDDIIESVISCVSAKETWTDLVHSFECPSDTKEKRIMDLNLSIKLSGQSPLKVSHGPTPGLRNANHTQTLNLADIYERFVYEDNLIQRRTSEEYLRDLDIEYHERALLANSKRFIKRRNNFSGQKANENTKCYKCGNKGHFARDYFSKTSESSYKSLVSNYSLVSKGFHPKFTPKLIQSSSNSNNQADQKFQKDYKAEYKKMKAKLALLEAKVSDEEEVTQVKVLMPQADDELTVGKSHARNGEWVDITMRKVNILLSIDEDSDWQKYLKYINIDLKFVEVQ